MVKMKPALGPRRLVCLRVARSRTFLSGRWAVCRKCRNQKPQSANLRQTSLIAEKCSKSTRRLVSITRGTWRARRSWPRGKSSETSSSSMRKDKLRIKKPSWSRNERIRSINPSRRSKNDGRKRKLDWEVCSLRVMAPIHRHYQWLSREVKWQVGAQASKSFAAWHK